MRAKMACIVAVTLLTAPGVVAANAIPLTGSVDNGEVRYDWEFFPTFGAAEFVISNIGTTPLTHFDLPITGLTEYEADPDFWTLSPETGTGMFTISSGGGELRYGDSFLVDYFFDPDAVVLGYADLYYEGFHTGTLHNIVTTTPEPATLTFFVIGAATLIRRKRR
ncbi:MAG: hypothetical protein ISS69_15025 [Phycisphaerae bacterium]|nr:hypothetical protein [Phycisphaerae bacterium]